MTTEAEDAPKKERWVYMGRRLDPKTHKLVYHWCPVNVDGEPHIAGTFTYDTRIEKNSTSLMPAVGAVFCVHTTNAGASVKIAGPLAPVYDTMLADQKIAAEWDVLEGADIIRHKVNKRMKEEMNEEVLGKALRPIVQAMRKTNSMGKDAIKLVVLNYLTRHGAG